MALSRLQATGMSSGTNSASVTFSSTPSAGNMITVNVCILNPGVGAYTFNVTDNKGNTYTVNSSGISNGVRAVAGYAFNITSSATFTVTAQKLTGSDTLTFFLCAEEWSGTGLTDPLAGSGTATGLSTSASATTAATGASEVAVIATMACRRINFNITAITVGALTPAFTQEFEQLASSFGAMGGEGDTRDDNTGTASGAQAVSWAISASGTNVNWAAAIIALAAAPPGSVVRMSQFSREIAEQDGTSPIHMSQFAREVAYPFACTPSGVPIPTPPPTPQPGCPEIFEAAPVTPDDGCDQGGVTTPSV